MDTASARGRRWAFTVPREGDDDTRFASGLPPTGTCLWWCPSAGPGRGRSNCTVPDALDSFRRPPMASICEHAPLAKPSKTLFPSQRSSPARRVSNVSEAGPSAARPRTRWDLWRAACRDVGRLLMTAVRRLRYSGSRLVMVVSRPPQVRSGTTPTDKPRTPPICQRRRRRPLASSVARHAATQSVIHSRHIDPSRSPAGLVMVTGTAIEYRQMSAAAHGGCVEYRHDRHRPGLRERV
jgi:hypothetical protein